MKCNHVQGYFEDSYTWEVQQDYELMGVATRSAGVGEGKHRLDDPLGKKLDWLDEFRYPDELKSDPTVTIQGIQTVQARPAVYP